MDVERLRIAVVAAAAMLLVPSIGRDRRTATARRSRGLSGTRRAPCCPASRSKRRARR